MSEKNLSRIETPSGKGSEDENFPVGSWIISHRLRPHIKKFYLFARAADDIADNPNLPAKEKIKRLYQYVAANIDYVGIELGIWAIKPRQAPKIFKDGY